MTSATEAQLRYLDPLPLYRHQKPYQCTIPIWHIKGAQQSNLSTSEHRVLVHDFSQRQRDFELDLQGFECRSLPTNLSRADFNHAHTIETTYFEECTQHLKDHFGAQEVFIFDHVVRASTFKNNVSVK